MFCTARVSLPVGDMNFTLNDAEVRVLGCLVEKELTTPDYYPLTLNALTNACNQKSNRNPVVSYDETAVVRALNGLRDKGLALQIHQLDSRVPKYGHQISEKLGIERPEVSLLCELMLRGPQTVGELRGRAARMYEHANLEEVESVLQGLVNRPEPLVLKLPRQAGRKERRYSHLLAGTPDLADEEASLPVEAATLQVQSEDARIAKLEEEVARMRDELNALKQGFESFRAELEG